MGREPSPGGEAVDAMGDDCFWLSISVELVTGRGRDWWLRPGRVFGASPRHTFAQLAEAIDTGFGR